MDKKYIRARVEAWIADEELATNGRLKPVRKFDGLYPEDLDEAVAYWDFIHWALTQEHAVLLTIPKQDSRKDFWQIETDDSISFLFGSADYLGRLPEFDRYQYRIKKVCEKVKDLAITYSCISNKCGKENTYNKYRRSVENEFQDQAKVLYDTLKKYPAWVNKQKLLERLTELNSRIRRCKRIWDKYAYWE